MKFICTNCKESFEKNDSDLNVESIGTVERPMGIEREFNGNIDIECPNCQNHIMIEFNFWEYPIMVLNYSQYSQEGCILTEEPDYESIINLGEINDETDEQTEI